MRILTLLPLMIACEGPPIPEITVFAAASLGPALERETPHFSAGRVRLNLGSTSALVQSIRRGAPADVLLSAGSAEIGSSRRLAGNDLVLIARADVDPPSLERAARIAIGDPNSVPAGQYARQALESLGLWDNVQPRLVPCSNVRVALGYVETGVADLGFVYATDVTPRVRILRRFDIPVEYRAAVIRDSTAARAFVEWITDGRLSRHGFKP